MREAAVRCVLVLMLCVAAAVNLRAAEGDAPAPIPPEVAELNKQVVTLYIRGRHAEAIPLARRYLAEVRKLRGDDDRHTAQAFYNLGANLLENGQLDAAEPELKQAAAIYRKAGGDLDPNYVDCLGRLTRLYSDKGELRTAEPLARQVLGSYRKTRGDVHPDVANALNDLATILQEQSDFAGAEPLFREGLAIYRKTRGDNHSDTSACLGNLGWLLTYRGDFAGAEPLFKEAVAIDRKIFGDAHPATGTALANLAALYQERADYAAAEPLLKEAVAIHRKTAGADHPRLALSLNRLGVLQIEKPDYPAAEASLKESLAIYRRSLGDNHSATADCLNNLGLMYIQKGDYAAAEPVLKEAVEIDRKLKTVGPTTARKITSLGSVYRHKEDFATAEAMYKEALEIQCKSLGDRHPEVAIGLNNFASLHLQRSEYAQARPLLRDALAINREKLGDNHPGTAATLALLAQTWSGEGDFAAAEPLMRQAYEIDRKVLGANHPDTVSRLRSLYHIVAGAGRATEALELGKTVWGLQVANRDSVLAGGSEREQIAYLVNANGNIGVFLTLAAEYLPGDAAAARFAAEVVLAEKGATIEAQARRHAVAARSDADPAVRAARDRWLAAVQERNRAMLAVPGPAQVEAFAARRQKAESDAEAAEKALAEASAPFADRQKNAAARLTQVAANLKPGEALVEYTSYYAYRFENLDPNGTDVLTYAAIVIRPGGKPGQEHVSLVPLGRGADIEKAIAGWRRAVLQLGSDQRGVGGIRAAGDSDRKLDTASAELARLLWAPVAAKLGDATKIYLSPDAAISWIPFAPMPSGKPGRMLIEDYDMTYLATGRDLLRRCPVSDQQPLLVGAPDYGLAPESAPVPTTQPAAPPGEDPPADQRSGGPAFFSALSGTGPEVHSLARILGMPERPITPLVGTAATEAAVKAAKHPAILHIATHGFWLASNSRGASAAATGPSRGAGGVQKVSPASGLEAATAEALWRRLQDQGPMHRSGIALAGANDTLAGRRPAGGDDGILTADEVVEMDLWGTRLVVLSACQTGLGDIRRGEGVFGMRRAFALAGAENLITTLWSVDDETTTWFMQTMYGHLSRGMTPPQAVRATQRQYLADARKKGETPRPYYWAAFVNSGTGRGL